tara:strand:- start:141 stop:299 length:159 start_codon:yes stop_codon:yes gene_type:complete
MWWLAASAACLGLLVFAWKNHMAQEVIWLGTLITCLALPAWAMFLDDDNAES